VYVGDQFHPQEHRKHQLRYYFDQKGIIVIINIFALVPQPVSYQDEGSDSVDRIHHCHGEAEENQADGHKVIIPAQYELDEELHSTRHVCGETDVFIPRLLLLSEPD
jgi:hypothetical protein